ncbi:putative ribonuclease H-like domain-containing protein [Tanacetum coccineum]|uniref:Ribonuclease H-like domain-containing protein n=1 Tax=Tanacetum coccineum TaxID=301880 RepID=A0ABQ5HHV1_9ASTR
MPGAQKELEEIALKHLGKVLKTLYHQQYSPQLILEEPKKISEALQDDSWVQAMQDELLQFKLQQVWVLVDLPHGMKVALGYTQEEGIDYDEYLAPVQNKAIRHILSLCSFNEVHSIPNVKTAITPPWRPKWQLTKDEDVVDVDVTLIQIHDRSLPNFTSHAMKEEIL